MRGNALHNLAALALANILTVWFNYHINDRKHGANIDHIFILLASQVP